MATSQKPRSVVVVGSGAAGIKAAHDLLVNEEIEEVTILEANSYIGGRMKRQVFEGHTVEFGANWISGLETAYQNPIWKMAKDAGLRGHKVDRLVEGNVIAKNYEGKDVTKEYLEAVEQVDNAYTKIEDKFSQIDTQHDRSIRSCLEEVGWKSSTSDAVKKAAEFNALEVWIAGDLERLSTFHELDGASDIELGKDEVFVEDEVGFARVLDGMVEVIKKRGGVIELNTRVETIIYKPGEVGVVAKNREGRRVERKADAVLCTVSLGVLQNEKIEFLPPLPKWKRNALNEIQMGVFAKVFVRFEKEFWPDVKHIVICGDIKGHYPLWMKYRHSGDRYLFMCYLGGDEARRVESLTEEQIKDEVETHFSKAFGKEMSGDHNQEHRFRPSAVAVTSWSKDPNFCGSYSYYPIHAFSKVPIDDLTKGLTGTDEQEGRITLHFAGECFDDEFSGWVQGAYRSGESVAKIILS